LTNQAGFILVFKYYIRTVCHNLSIILYPLIP
jgi:hypothetical protein